MENSRDELMELYFRLGIVKRDYCEGEENSRLRQMAEANEPLPEGIYKTSDGFYCRYSKTDLTKDEFHDLLLCRQLRYLKSIKNSVTFFVVLTVIGLVAGLMLALGAM